jgi:hypothetical protein
MADLKVKTLSEQEIVDEKLSACAGPCNAANRKMESLSAYMRRKGASSARTKHGDAVTARTVDDIAKAQDFFYAILKGFRLTDRTEHALSLLLSCYAEEAGPSPTSKAKP